METTGFLRGVGPYMFNQFFFEIERELPYHTLQQKIALISDDDEQRSVFKIFSR